MNKYISHLKTICKHKYWVMKFCFKCGYYKRGLLHDLSKFGKTEFVSSAKYYQGNRSPIDAEKEVKGYSLAWQHHKGHNAHHWEYWIDNIGTYQNTPCKIPYEYVIEMICDWLGASIVYSKEKINCNEPYIAPIQYYKKCSNERIFYPQTKELIEYYLNVIANKSINTFCQTVKHNKNIKSEYINSSNNNYIKEDK